MERLGCQVEDIDRMCAYWADQLNKAHKKGMQHGMQRAIQLITPENPHARSSYAEGRNQCCRVIRDAMEKET